MNGPAFLEQINVAERVDAEGNILQPLDEVEVEVEVAALQLKAQGCEAMLIAFLHSYANSAHERRAAEIAAGVWGNPYITISASVLAEFRETEPFAPRR